jgi:hypothetical protein
MRTILSIASLFVAYFAHAQYYTSSANNVRFVNRPNGFITQLPPAPPALVGSYYLYSDWTIGDVFLKDSTSLRGLSLRLDVKHNNIEINHAGEIKILPVAKCLVVLVKKNDGTTEEFVNADLFVQRYGNTQGLLRSVVAGDVALFAKTNAETISANYNAALDVGKRDNEIVLNTIYYFAKGNKLIPASENKKKFKAIMADEFPSTPWNEIKVFNLRKPSHLIELTSLLAGQRKEKGL